MKWIKVPVNFSTNLKIPETYLSFLPKAIVTHFLTSVNIKLK